MANSAAARKSAPAAKKGARASLAQVTAHAPETLITYRVSVLAQVLSRLVDTSVREAHGLTSRQWRVLVMLSRLGAPSSSGEIARSANFDHSQVSRVAMELVEKGLVTQGNDPEDRRRQILTLTPAGIDYLRNGLPASMEREARLRGRLTAAEYATFTRVLGLLEDEAGKLLDEVKNAG
jgi:DNA-binding MarR family transcriptional regulator